jgi:hypothetical protein
MEQIHSSKTVNCTLCWSTKWWFLTDNPLDLVLSQIIAIYALQMHFSRLLCFLQALFSGIWCRVCWQFGVVCVLAIWCRVCVGNLVSCVCWQFFDPFTPLSWRWRKHVFPKSQQISSGLHGVTFSKTVRVCCLYLKLGLKISPLLQVFWTKSSVHFSSRPCVAVHVGLVILTIPGGEYKLCNALLIPLPV